MIPLFAIHESITCPMAMLAISTRTKTKYYLTNKRIDSENGARVEE